MKWKLSNHNLRIARIWFFGETIDSTIPEED